MIVFDSQKAEGYISATLIAHSDSMEEPPDRDPETFDRLTVPSPAYNWVEGFIEGWVNPSARLTVGSGLRPPSLP